MGELENLLNEVSQGDRYARAFLENISEVSHLWDDLIDKDKGISDERVNRVMWMVLQDLPRNPFYAANFRELSPVLMMAMVNWELATHIERNPTATYTQLLSSFILRSSYCDLAVMVAMIKGGREFAVRMAEKLRAFIHDEGFEGYQSALLEEAKARGE